MPVSTDEKFGAVVDQLSSYIRGGMREHSKWCVLDCVRAIEHNSPVGGSLILSIPGKKGQYPEAIWTPGGLKRLLDLGVLL